MIKHTIVNNSTCTLDADKTYFDPASILSFAAEISGDFSLQTEDSENCTSIRLSSKHGDITEEIVERLSQSLVDHQVRLNLQKENGHVRDMIVEQAFSSTRK